MTEYVTGMATVKSLQMEPVRERRYGDLLAQYLAAGFETKQLANTYNTVANALEQTMTLAILGEARALKASTINFLGPTRSRAKNQYQPDDPWLFADDRGALYPLTDGDDLVMGQSKYASRRGFWGRLHIIAHKGLVGLNLLSICAASNRLRSQGARIVYVLKFPTRRDQS